MSEKVLDIVCGMRVAPDTAAAKSEYQGEKNKHTSTMPIINPPSSWIEKSG